MWRVISELRCLAETSTKLSVHAVVVLAASGQHSLHDAANRIVLHLNQKMNVVGHQTVGVEVEGQLHYCC